jgi:DNA-binding transcriptional LysR family regulator
MPLSAHQLDAFHAVAETGGFSKAAKRLGVTQPALSQRIQQLEGELKRRLFVRSPTGVSVTDAGARLLRYCEAQRALESEVLDDLAVDSIAGGAKRELSELSGTVRIASFSSVGRSCVLPALASVFRENPRLIIDFTVKEIHELEPMLGQGSAELVILDHVVPRPDVEAVPLGFEELVLVESKKLRTRDDVYLDHDPDDTTTLKFLGRNNVKTRYVRRSFFDDIYGVLDAAKEGYGRAVVPKHLLLIGDYQDSLRVVPDMRATRSPVVMHHFRQPSYTRAFDAVTQALTVEVPVLLGGKKRNLGRFGTVGSMK